MHLTYPKDSDRFTTEELGCLSAALGFHEDIFQKHIPELLVNDCHCVETKVLCELIERKVFDSDLHRSYNLHDGVYNADVLLKAVHVLSNHALSFAELKNVRIAFQFYECVDLTGLEANVHTILRTLKMCGRVISPKQLVDHLRHMPRLALERLMLFEFIDLFQVCEKICDIKKIVQPGLKDCSRDSSTKTANHHAKACRSRGFPRDLMERLAWCKVYTEYNSSDKVGNFNEILQQDDKRVLEYLDRVYEKKCFRPPFVTKPTWRVPPREMINNKKWRKQVASYRGLTAGLDATIDRSNKKVYRTKHGVLDDTVQFVDLNVVHDAWGSSHVNVSPQMIDLGGHGRDIHLTSIRSNKVKEASGDVLTAMPPRSHQCPTQSPFSGRLCENCLSNPSTYLSQRSTLKDVQILVSQEELHDTRTKIVNLLWDIEMKDEADNGTDIDGGQKINRSVRQRNINDISVTSHEQREDKKVEKEHQKLLRSISQHHCPSTPNVYNFLKSRSEDRDALLDRTSPFPTRTISRTQQSRSRKSMDKSNRTFLSTA